MVTRRQAEPRGPYRRQCQQKWFVRLEMRAGSSAIGRAARGIRREQHRSKQSHAGRAHARISGGALPPGRWCALHGLRRKGGRGSRPSWRDQGAGVVEESLDEVSNMGVRATIPVVEVAHADRTAVGSILSYGV